MGIRNWCQHRKSCKEVRKDDQLVEQLKAKDEQLKAKDEQLRVKDEQLCVKDEQLKEYMRQLAAKDEQILNLTNQLLQQANKRLNANETQKDAKRKKLSEPERRKIAIRQEWNCANPDGKCRLKGKLQEYDIDHVIPLCKGGKDDPSNFQAICPACHRRKTERDLSPGATAEPAEVD